MSPSTGPVENKLTDRIVAGNPKNFAGKPLNGRSTGEMCGFFETAGSIICITKRYSSTLQKRKPAAQRAAGFQAWNRELIRSAQPDQKL
jgi:hypothetical protein